jgi:hypothetical protein
VRSVRRIRVPEREKEEERKKREHRERMIEEDSLYFV